MLPPRQPLPTLEESRLLRLSALFLLYLAQGVPIGLFSFAIPAWMAANGAGAQDIAYVLGFAVLPWSLKLVNGFIMDRFTYLAMGRRRVWLVGAQIVMVLSLLLAAVVAPGPGDVALLALLGFLVNSATTFQDVAVDGLAVDIMPEEERALASGMMFGGQAIGIATGTVVCGSLIAFLGPSAAYLGAALMLSAVVLFVVCVRERAGERHLPWTAGGPTSANLALQVGAWLPILRNTLAALTRPTSLLWLPVLLAQGVNYGIWLGITPLLAVTGAGWSEAAATSLIGTAQLIAGIIGLTAGAGVRGMLGPKQATLLCFGVIAAGSVAVALLESRWTETRFLTAFIFGWVLVDVLHRVVSIPISMQLCDRTVAATQFTIYMATSNIGISIGAALVGVTAAFGGVAGMIWIVVGVSVLGGGCVVGMAILETAREPQRSRPLGLET